MMPLYVTSGEPAGIGPDICLSLSRHRFERPVVVLADRSLLQSRATQLGYEVELLDYTGQPDAAMSGDRKSVV